MLYAFPGIDREQEKVSFVRSKRPPEVGGSSGSRLAFLRIKIKSPENQANAIPCGSSANKSGTHPGWRRATTRRYGRIPHNPLPSFQTSLAPTLFRHSGRVKPRGETRFSTKWSFSAIQTNCPDPVTSQSPGSCTATKSLVEMINCAAASCAGIKQKRIS